MLSQGYSAPRTAACEGLKFVQCTEADKEGLNQVAYMITVTH